MTQPDLSGLHDIIEPIQPSFFPPAPGWWLVLIATLIALLISIFGVMHHYFSPLPYALRELKKSHRRTRSAAALAGEVTKLLKRAAILRFGSQKVAALSDTAWVRFLFLQSRGKISKETLKFIAFSTYLPDNDHTPMSKKKVYRAAQKLLKYILKGKKHEHHH